MRHAVSYNRGSLILYIHFTDFFENRKRINYYYPAIKRTNYYLVNGQ